MTRTLFFLFLIGLIFCLLAPYAKGPKVISRTLFAIGSLLVALPFVLFLYFFTVIFYK